MITGQANPEDPSAGLTTTSQEVVAEQNDPRPADPNEPTKARKKVWEEFKSRIEHWKSYRRKLSGNWTSNIDQRRGKAFASQTDEDRINVPVDWYMTKAKQASLFSQVPQGRINHPPDTLAPEMVWVQAFEKRINDTLVQAGIESAMDEVLPDVINAAGIGAVLVAYESITEPKEVPAIDMATLDPQVAMQIMQSGMMPDGTPVPMETVPEVVAKRYTTTRISPTDLLLPMDFNGSDFDNASWIGRSGRITWAQAQTRFSLKDDEKNKVLGDDRTTLDRLNNDNEKDKPIVDEMVSFDEIFYKEFQYDPEAKSFSTIHHLVFITGKKDPVIDGPWEGQRETEEGDLIGAMKYPIRLLTLAYISDEAIPPSDTAMGRPQANEINKSRTQIIMQRDRNIPVRWGDINRLDPTVMHGLMRGTWGNIIPVQGNGNNILGEVAKSSIPQENFTFDQIIKGDLSEIWSLGPNQLGSGVGVETKGEGDTIQSNFQTRLGRERAKVAKFFCSIAEVMGGLLCLYEDPASMGEGFDPAISKTLAYSILADSTVLLDSQQRTERLERFINFVAKTGWLNLDPVLKEYASLSGLDPNTVITAPQPKPPVEPNISLRLTGAEDLTNPLTLAFLLKSGQAPDAALIEQAKQLISMVVTPSAPPAAPQMTTNADGSTEIVPQAESKDESPKLRGMEITLAPAQQAQPETPPEAAPPEVGEANPNWTAMPRVNQRAVGAPGSEDQ